MQKKFGHLIELHGGSYEKEDPLHNRAGKYIKLLESQGRMQPISVRIMKSSISIFDELNSCHAAPEIRLFVFNPFPGFDCIVTALKSRIVAHKTRTKFLLKFVRD